MKNFSALCVCLLLCLAACQPADEPVQQAVVEPAAAAPDASELIRALANEYVSAYFESFPDHALGFGAPDTEPDRLSDHSLESLGRWQVHQQDMLARLNEIDADTIAASSEQITAIFLRNQLENARDVAVCRMELWNVSPTWTSWLAEFTVLAGQLKMDSPQARADALSRMSQMPAYIDTEIANLKEGVELGYTAPQNSVRAVLDQIDAFLELPIAGTPFAIVAAEQDIAYQEKVAAVVSEGIMPAIARYRDYLKNSYAGTAREAVGVDANPDGAACYRAAVRYHATVDLSAEEIHQIGLTQMELIMAEMREIGARSFGEDDPLALMALVKSDPRYMFSSRQEMIELAEAAVERSYLALPDWFGVIPRAPVVVEPYPSFQEKSAPGGQAVPPAADGSKPGKYLINTYQPENQSRAGLESTAFHEAYPGHHMQISIALERSDLHPISRYFFLSGFGEGWALYTERLADEMGLFSSDLDRLGLLSNEAMRAARLVVDSGMHGLGWSREQALDYLDSHTANARANSAAEIDRYIAVPGQATAYMLGNLEIRRLREMAEAALGEAFDIRAFHDLVLEDGTVPLTYLATKVEAWITGQAAAAL